jgi:tetratricopeptide (TPR) repeat protein
MRRALALLALAAALAGLAAGTRLALEPEASRSPPIRNPAFLPSGRAARATAFGQRLLLSDLYWLRTVQYMGESAMAGGKRWEALFPLADLVTDLDPRHGYAYQVAGSNLGGLAHRYDEADRILQKGMKALPERWALPFVYATNKFLYEQKYAEAAEYARRAGEVGHRPHLALLAANLSALADTDDEYRASLVFLDEMMDKAGTDELKAELQERRVKIETYMVLSRVEKALAAYQQAAGRRAARLGELVPRWLPALPPDPSGGVLHYDPATGQVQSSRIGPRSPLRITR